MRNLYRSFVFGLVSILTVSALASCGGVTSGTEEDFSKLVAEIDLDADEGFSGELNVLTTSEESEIVTMNALVKAFNEKYPHIKVNCKQELLDGYYSSLTTTAGTAINQKDHALMPDVFWFAQDKLDTLYSQGEILFPLSAIDEKDDSFSEDLLVEEALSVSKINNQLYLMPRDYNQVVMYFNQDIFDAAGVEYPTAQMSKSEFVSMLSALRSGLNASEEKNDYGVLYKDAVKTLIDVNSQWDSWVWPLVKGFGGRVVDSEGNSTLNSENVYNAVAFWKSLRDNKYVGEITTMNSGVNFRMQQSAIYFHARAVLSDITKSTKQIKGVQNLGVTAIPQFGSEYAVGGGSSGYGMYKNAVNKTAAWLFLKFIVSEAGQNAFCATGNGVPAAKALLHDENATWRKYSNDALGTAFDVNAFVYGLDGEKTAFASTRDFYQYIPLEVQEDVLTCLRSCFNVIDSQNNTEKDIRDQIANQAELIEYYIKRANR